MLVAAGLVTVAQVDEALAQQKKTGLRLGETLVSLGYVNEAQMTQVLSNQLSIPWVNLYHVDFSRELLAQVPADLAEQYRLIPVYVRNVRRQGDTLYVAMDDPLDLSALQQIADHAGLPVKPMVAAPGDIENAIRVYYLGLPPLPPVEPPNAPEPEPKQAAVKPTPVASPSTPRPVGRHPEPAQPAPRREPAQAPERAAPSRSTTQTSGASFLTLTLLDGTQVRLPSDRKAAGTSGGEGERPEAHGLTTRDLIAALQARAAGEDVSEVLPDGAWEPLFAALLSVLLRKGLIADWEFVDEWKKHRSGENPAI